MVWHPRHRLRGGSYFAAGQEWRGETPPGIATGLHCETSLGSSQFRTRLFNPSDPVVVEVVNRRQDQVPH